MYIVLKVLTFAKRTSYFIYKIFLFIKKKNNVHVAMCSHTETMKKTMYYIYFIPG